jgi:hypothetical protein
VSHQNPNGTRGTGQRGDANATPTVRPRRVFEVVSSGEHRGVVLFVHEVHWDRALHFIAVKPDLRATQRLLLACQRGLHLPRFGEPRAQRRHIFHLQTDPDNSLQVCILVNWLTGVLCQYVSNTRTRSQRSPATSDECEQPTAQSAPPSPSGSPE